MPPHRFFDPVLRPERTGSDSVTWGEMVEARLLAEDRSRKVPVQKLRPAVVALRPEFGRCPLAMVRPFLTVEGRELVRIVQDRVPPILDDLTLAQVDAAIRFELVAGSERAA